MITEQMVEAASLIKRLMDLVNERRSAPSECDGDVTDLIYDAAKTLEAATALSHAEGSPRGIGDSVAINRIVEEIQSKYFAEAVEACVKIAEKYANSTYAKPTRNAGFCAGQIAAEMRALLPTRPREQEGAEPVALSRLISDEPWYSAECDVRQMLEERPPHREDFEFSRDIIVKVGVRVLNWLKAHPPAASFQAGADGWNYDMNAAPKDGTRLWVYRPCIEPDDCQEVSWWHDDSSGFSYWRNAADNDKPDPTAWRQLPIPATSEGR